MHDSDLGVDVDAKESDIAQHGCSLVVYIEAFQVLASSSSSSSTAAAEGTCASEGRRDGFAELWGRTAEVA